MSRYIVADVSLQGNHFSVHCLVISTKRFYVFSYVHVSSCLILINSCLRGTDIKTLRYYVSQRWLQRGQRSLLILVMFTSIYFNCQVTLRFEIRVSDCVSATEIRHSQDTEKVTDSIIFLKKQKIEKTAAFSVSKESQSDSGSIPLLPQCCCFLVSHTSSMKTSTMIFRVCKTIEDHSCLKKRNHLSSDDRSTLIVHQFSHPSFFFFSKAHVHKVFTSFI